MSRAGRKTKSTMNCLLALPKRRGRKTVQMICGYCGEIGHKAVNCHDKKSKRKEDSKDKSDKKEMQKHKKDSKGKDKSNMSKLKWYNCEETGSFCSGLSEATQKH